VAETDYLQLRSASYVRGRLTVTTTDGAALSVDHELMPAEDSHR
jgi:hypothetical protein